MLETSKDDRLGTDELMLVEGIPLDDSRQTVEDYD